MFQVGEQWFAHPWMLYVVALIASMRHVWRVKAYSLHLVHLGFRGRERAPMGGGSAKKKMSKERGRHHTCAWIGTNPYELHTVEHDKI